MIHAIKQYISREFIFPKAEMRDSEDLSGVAVIVTGASRGIGKAITETLLSKGCAVLAVSRSIDDLQIAYPQKSERLLLCEADVTKEIGVKKIVDTALANFKAIDVLINNAGMKTEQAIDDASEQDFDDMMNTNVKAAFLMCKYVTPIMKKHKKGFIVNIGSKISHNTNVSPNRSLYAMTKYALEGFSLALNNELKQFGIRVSCLLPGTVNTFVSFQAKEYLSPYQVAEIVAIMIRFDDIDFESVIIKSKNQHI